ncbi:MAG: endonuclease III domain-containing protein [Candidatus Polarisedimenticolaceae bacterium]|nr:endonuclease III domain-containing protein [Candidatus Polarisedimenticolaceae bacterium]
MAIFQTMLKSYGPQGWWPGETAFEVMVGAILTQNTAWPNVEKAINNLKQAGIFSLPALLDVPHEALAQLIRPSGYFNIKAGRLQQFCRFLQEQGGEEALRKVETARLRQLLLGVKGVGPETADDMLLYAFQRPVFVVDAYTRRIFSCLGMVSGDEPYEVLRMGFESALATDVVLFNEYHALIVRHAKDFCNKKPRCVDCPLAKHCTIP